MHVKRVTLHDKVRRIFNKTFELAGIERPQNEVMHLFRVIGMHRGVGFNAPKKDITQMSDHRVTDNNGVDKSYFSQTPAKSMLAMSGFIKGNE